jgi:hypothetical protein
MIDLGTIAGLHEHDHQLAAYCPRCDARRVLPLAETVAAGQGARRLPIRVRCRACGEFGQLQVRPPMPAWISSNGWIQISTN